MRDDRDADRTAERPEAPRRAAGGTRESTGRERQASSADREKPRPEEAMELEQVLHRENLNRAWRRVVSNGGAPGVDGMSVEALGAYLKEHGPRIREALISGTYEPQPVRRVEIPKPDGKGRRMLGIPTVLDRLIQQAILQVLTPQVDPHFSPSSYGFRPGKSAHDALRAALGHVEAGYGWVVDIDLEKFFDRVNHDVLMARVAKRVRDKRLLRLIRAYLNAGIMADGVVQERIEGTPQGGPLSPLLSNILLDDLDKELERRGHRFCRYADDCNIYVKSEAAGQRVMESITGFLEKRLRLKVNREKSAVARPGKRKFLGYTIMGQKSPRLKASSEAVRRLKGRLKKRLRKGRGQAPAKLIAEIRPLLLGWVQYFKLASVKSTFEDLDQWLRRKIRCILWRQWKKPRTRARKLMAWGIAKERAWRSVTNGRGAWWNAGASHMNAAITLTWFSQQGLVSLREEHRRLNHPT